MSPPSPFEPIFTKEFKENTKKLDHSLRLELDKKIKKIIENPRSKPLGHEYKNCKSERVGGFRIVYKIQEGKIFFITFAHRPKAYRRR